MKPLQISTAGSSFAESVLSICCPFLKEAARKLEACFGNARTVFALPQSRQAIPLLCQSKECQICQVDLQFCFAHLMTVQE